MIEFTRVPSNSHANNNNNNEQQQPQENVIYRLDPVREKGKLIFQLGTSDAGRAVAAARLVAGDVAGIDVNAGCPKPFSISGGMGAALLRTPDKLAGILEALVREVTPAFGVGVSVKIRLLETAAETEALVRRLVATGITGLTVHCRTTPMRPRERAIRGQLPMIAALCREAGVACLMNGDVESRDHAARLVPEFGVDGAMIATAAEKNPSCFRPGPALEPWPAVVERYVRAAMEVENRFHNTKYLLAQMVPGKQPVYKELMRCRSHVQLAEAFGFDEGMKARAREMDQLQALGEFEVKQAKKGKGAVAAAAAALQANKGAGNDGQNESKKRKREQEEDEAAGEPGKRKAEQVPAAPVAAPAPVAV